MSVHEQHGRTRCSTLLHKVSLLVNTDTNVNQKNTETTQNGSWVSCIVVEVKIKKKKKKDKHKPLIKKKKEKETILSYFTSLNQCSRGVFTHFLTTKSFLLCGWSCRVEASGSLAFAMSGASMWLRTCCSHSTEHPRACRVPFD